MIKTWAFSIFMDDKFPKPEDFSSEVCQAIYNRYIELWVDLERWGFEGVFLAEHHFQATLLGPSPHLLIAAVAGRTKTLRLGTLGQVLPMHDARRFVEEVGMLDYITNGRLEIGIAPGAGDVEFVRAGFPSEELRPRYHSVADVLAKAMEGPTTTHHDEFTNLEAVPILPRVRPNPRPNIWATVMSPNSVEWCAQRGWKICTAWFSQPVVNALAQTYRDAAENAGQSAHSNNLGLRRRVFVAPSDAEADELALEAFDLLRALAGEDLESADPNKFELLNEPDDFVIGSPQTVAEKLIDQCRQGGYGHLAAWTDFKSFKWHDLVRSHRLLGTEVAPILRSASVEKVGEPASEVN